MRCLDGVYIELSEIDKVVKTEWRRGHLWLGSLQWQKTLSILRALLVPTYCTGNTHAFALFFL